MQLQDLKNHIIMIQYDHNSKMKKNEKLMRAGAN